MVLQCERLVDEERVKREGKRGCGAGRRKGGIEENDVWGMKNGDLTSFFH